MNLFEFMELLHRDIIRRLLTNHYKFNVKERHGQNS